MSFSLTIKRRFESSVLEKLNSRAMRRVIKAVGEEEIELIRKRTNRGVDKDGRPFKKLSKAYSKRKRQMIKGGKGGGRVYGAKKMPSFMRMTGQMLGDMKIKNIKFTKTRNGARASYDVGFKSTRSARIASYHNDTGAGKSRVKRKWLGRAKTRQQVAKLERKWRSEIRRELS